MTKHLNMKDFNRREKEKVTEIDAKSKKNPKGGFRQKLIDRGVY